MISTILATYNSHKYIINQLDSIRKQTRSVDELIIFDDCSTDDTVPILKKYITKYQLENWKLFCHKKNEGFIKTFSDCLGHTNGDIILLCDHDDVWESNKVELIEKIFDENENILCLATGFEEIDENGDIIKVKKKSGKSNNNLIRREVQHNSLNKMSIFDVGIYNISPGCTYAINKKIKEEYLKTIETQYLPHDYKMTEIAACLNGLYYYDVIMTKYRIHVGNTIGLSHQGDYNKRVAMIEHNVEEKREMYEIAKRYYNKGTDELNYLNNICSVFLKRKNALKNKNIIEEVYLFFKTMKWSKFYESIALDIYAILRSY